MKRVVLGEFAYGAADSYRSPQTVLARLDLFPAGLRVRRRRLAAPAVPTWATRDEDPPSRHGAPTLMPNNGEKPHPPCLLAAPSSRPCSRLIRDTRSSVRLSAPGRHLDGGDDPCRWRVQRLAIRRVRVFGQTHRDDGTSDRRCAEADNVEDAIASLTIAGHRIGVDIDKIGGQTPGPARYALPQTCRRCLIARTARRRHGRTWLRCRPGDVPPWSPGRSPALQQRASRHAPLRRPDGRG